MACTNLAVASPPKRQTLVRPFTDKLRSEKMEIGEISKLYKAQSLRFAICLAFQQSLGLEMFRTLAFPTGGFLSTEETDV